VNVRLETIAAIATAPGAGGVAIIRVSGSDARAIVGSIFRRRSGHGIPTSRRVYVGQLVDRPGGGVVDEVLVFAMKGPHSYTGEDVVEIQCHGGSLVSQRVLESVCVAGARPAQAGEFTKRAFLNGRLDLAQAEAVADLIMASSEGGRRLAWSQLDGTLSSRVRELRETILRARALCEVALDFSDEEVPGPTEEELKLQLSGVRGELEALTQSFERGRLRYQGARVALVGRPNVGKSSLLNALRKSLRRLGLNQVDLYQVHWPFPPVSIETWASGLADAVEHGLTKAVGVSNYNLNQMRRAQATLVKRGVLLASNQVEYSLINRKIEFNGLLSCCQELGITLLAYSPLAQGLLTGKYTSKTPPPGIRGRRYSRRVLENIQPLIRLLQDIGRNHEGKTTAQVAINWLICKGVVPIPGAKNAKQAIENAGAIGWKLSNEEVERLDQASRDIN